MQKTRSKTAKGISRLTTRELKKLQKETGLRREGLKDIMKDDSYHNEKMTGDIDFEKLLKEQRELEDKPRMDVMERIDLMDEITEGEGLDPLYANVINRIDQETDYFEKFKETGLFPVISSGLRTEKIDGVEEIIWGSEDLKVTGHFNFRTRNILMKYPRPDREIILSSLAFDGFLPEELNVLQHETVHSLQHRSGRPLITGPYDKLRVMGLLAIIWVESITRGGVNKDRILRLASGLLHDELREVQAHRSSDPETYWGPERRLLTKKGVVDRIKGAKGYSHLSVDQLIYGIDAVDKLNALGFSLQQVGEIIQDCGRWNKKTLSYPKIDQIIEEQLSAKDWTAGDLENKVLEDRVKKNIARLKAMHIAQEELRKAASRL